MIDKRTLPRRAARLYCRDHMMAPTRIPHYTGFGVYAALRLQIEGFRIGESA